MTGSVVDAPVRRVISRVSGQDFTGFFDWCQENIGDAMIYSGADEDGQDWMVRSTILGDHPTVYYLLRWGGAVL